MEQPATVELFRECDQSGTLAQQHVGLQGRRVRPAKRQLESGDYKAGETLQYRYLRNRRGSPCGLRRQGARATRRICTSAIGGRIRLAADGGAAPATGNLGARGVTSAEHTAGSAAHPPAWTCRLCPLAVHTKVV